MNDERLLSEMRHWLQSEQVPLPDAVGAAERIASQLPTTGQRRRRRWRPPFLVRTLMPPSTLDTTEYQPSPIPASNGHTPTVIGRTSPMLSPVKAITAGAIVFAIGSALLVAQPFEQQGTVPGAAETSPAPPVEFSGRWGHGPQITDSTVTTVDGGVAVTGAVFQPFVAHMSDPRLAGDVTVTPNSITYGPGRGPVLWHKAFRIENEDGAWQEQPSFTMYYPDGSGWDWTSVLVGEGGYEGLLAIANVHHDDSGWDLEGYIVEGGPPEAPQTTSR